MTLHVYEPDRVKLGWDNDPRRNPHMGGSIALVLKADADLYGVTEQPVQTVPKRLYAGLRLAFWHHTGWLLGYTVTQVGTKYFECVDRSGFTNVCAIYSGEWEYADEVSAKAENPVWANCQYPVSSDRRGNILTCNRGHLVPSVIFHARNGHSLCPVHDVNPYLGPATREPMKAEVKAEYDAVFAECAA